MELINTIRKKAIETKVQRYDTTSHNFDNLVVFINLSLNIFLLINHYKIEFSNKY